MRCELIILGPENGNVAGVYSSPTKQGLVIKRRVKRYRSPETASSGNGRQSGTKDTDVRTGKVVGAQADTSQVQPFRTRFALQHGLPLVDGVADTPCAFIGQTAAISGWSVRTGRAVERV